MRRAEREVTELNQLEEILRECQVVRIGAQDQEGLFVVPVNFGYRLEGRELTLYFHSAREGRKAAAFRAGGRVAFEMDCGHSLYTAATACGRRCAMIVGVATLEPWRRQGCAAHLVSRLCQELQGQGRDLVCLFYQTPQAGRVYQRLGFVPVGRYGLLNPSP